MDRVIALGGPVCLSVCHTRELRLNGSRYRNVFSPHKHSSVSSILNTNFVVLSLGVRECGKERHPLLKAKI